MSPRCPPFAFDDYDEHRYHLGYEGWPAEPLPFECLRIANDMRRAYSLPPVTIHLKRPWIQAVPWQTVQELVIGFSDEWFELKYGIYRLVARQAQYDYQKGTFIICPPQSRWHVEGQIEPSDWLHAVRRIAACEVFLGCCSALHVLAVAMGKTVVVMEPNTQRHHDIFYPLGKTGRVQLVLGGDGLPTFDSRHCADAVQEALRAIA